MTFCLVKLTPGAFTCKWQWGNMCSFLMRGLGLGMRIPPDVKVPRRRSSTCNPVNNCNGDVSFSLDYPTCVVLLCHGAELENFSVNLLITSSRCTTLFFFLKMTKMAQYRFHCRVELYSMYRKVRKYFIALITHWNVALRVSQWLLLYLDRWPNGCIYLAKELEQWGCRFALFCRVPL